ncbi:alpha/beta hydrolase [Streptomyces sp. BH106]|uniref:alpha/beta hydrolase n=1 Tax=Streptomyces sp. BH106 TaxID=3410409 RepID=UPI003CF2B475
MRRRPLSLALAILTVAATATTGASAATPDTEAGAADSPRWGACPQQDPPKDSPKDPHQKSSSRLECSTLQVPLDYGEPDGRRIEIAISRLASDKPAKRRGVLFVNPGGPGGEGLDYPALLAPTLPQSVLDSYDVIGFDPRGVGRSTPVTCDLTPQQRQRGNFPQYAHTAADVLRETKHARTVARQCAASRTSWMLPHITTANTARDMDRVRAALGAPKLSYLGHSYGTHLGAVYTTLFPERSDRIVLDSNLGPDGYDRTAFRMLGRGMQDRFPDFAAYAAAHPEYGLGATPRQVTATFFRLAKRLDAHPVDGIDGTAFRGLTFDRLYSDALMPTLAKDWQALDQGKPPSPAPSAPENLMAAWLHVLCNDTRWPRQVRDYQRDAALDRLRYPMVGGSTGSIGPCAYWPDQHAEPPVRITDRGPSNVLMAQNERDPGTPLAGARKLRQALGKRATMVTVDQGGHGVYPFGRNTCANDTVTAFLTTGQRPSRDLACAAEPGK